MQVDLSSKTQLYYYGVIDSNDKADFILNIYELFLRINNDFAMLTYFRLNMMKY